MVYIYGAKVLNPLSFSKQRPCEHSSTQEDTMITVKQTKPITPPEGIDLSRQREPDLRYVYKLTAFVSLGALLFGYDQGVMGELATTIHRVSAAWR